MFVVSQSSDENAQTCARDHTNRANLRKAFAFADFGKRREAVEYPRCHRLFLSLDRATAVDRYPSGCNAMGLREAAQVGFLTPTSFVSRAAPTRASKPVPPTNGSGKHGRCCARLPPADERGAVVQTLRVALCDRRKVVGLMERADQCHSLGRVIEL
jgi:hypothetical protein